MYGKCIRALTFENDTHTLGFTQRLSTFDLLLPPMPASAMPVKSSWLRDGEEEHQLEPLRKVVRAREALNEFGQTPWLYPTPVLLTTTTTDNTTTTHIHTHTHTHIYMYTYPCAHTQQTHYLFVCIYVYTDVCTYKY